MSFYNFMNLSTSSTKIVAPPTVTSIGIGENSPDMNDAVDGAISVLLFDSFPMISIA